MPNVKKVITFSLFLLALSTSGVQAGVTPPVTTLAPSPATPNGNNGWYTVPIQLTLSATDLESGVASINYRLDNGLWKTSLFENTLNLAPNPSFEQAKIGGSGVYQWDISVNDGYVTHSRDSSNYAPGFESSSAKIVATQGPWHGIKNSTNFSVVTPLSNMSASVWVKTENASNGAYFKVYMLTKSGENPIQTTLLGQSPAVLGTTSWTKLTYNFTVTSPTAIGIYLDIGLEGSGSLWADAVNISESTTNAQTTFPVGADGIHVLEYYSVDRAGNTETTKTFNFKIDQTPPGNWHDSGAIRALTGSSHELYVHSVVEDTTSGLSTNTDRYQYHVDRENGYGKYTELLYCNTPWLENEWEDLDSPVSEPGDNSALLRTPKTDFCNSNWKVCKTVKFYAEDMAGNSVTKDFCINGPWIEFTGGAAVRSNSTIDMVAEPEEDNTDGLIEIEEGIVNFFTSSRDWVAMFVPEPKELGYEELLKISVTPQTTTQILAQSGVYKINGNFELKSNTIPSAYKSSSFSQIYFIDGNLRISSNITTQSDTAALYVVSGDVEISKSVDTLGIAIISDGTFYTAYDINEGEATSTLSLYGMYTADKFIFKRTLQGTNNSKYPSEDFVYEPKFLVLLNDYMGRANIEWKAVD